MKDVTIIIPIHKFDQEIEPLLRNAVKNVLETRECYKEGKLPLLLVGPSEIFEESTLKEILELDNVDKVVNDGKTDYCSQINLAAKNVKTPHFSILEFDDLYNEKWFTMANEYFYGNESVSVFLPINVIISDDTYGLCNEVAWASAFSDEIGYLDHDCLSDYAGFNLTGGIFDTNDFNTIGGLKSTIEVAFNYEFLLRLTSKNLKVFVVPKQGYQHFVGRKGSLIDEIGKKPKEEIEKWFDIAKIEHVHTEERKIDIKNIKEEILK